MKRIFQFVVVTLFAVSAVSCEPNEISFVVEHVKALPDPPDCSYSVSDSSISNMTVDLAFIPSVENAFMVKNQLISREDYNNLDAETNGILVEYYKTSVILTASNETVGSSTIDYNYYIAPESSDIVLAQTIPSSVATALAEDLGCLGFNETNYPPGDMFGTNERTDRRGNPVPRDLGTVYSRVRFYGHTQGGDDVKTQWFTFPINLCCGCSINWSNCDSECGRYCEDVDEADVCTPGVPSGGSFVDCRSAYHNAAATWPSEDCTDEDGNPRACTCDDCGN